MSSVLRHYSQVPVRTMYLRVVAAPTRQDEAISFEAGYPGAIVESPISSSVIVVAQGQLLKDLGRSVMVVNADGDHLALYREVLRMENAAAEGVGPTPPFFVKVWSADGLGVIVARLG